MPRVIAPLAGHDDGWFWDGVSEGRLLLRTCAACGRLQHPPTPLCPACGSDSWSTREASGRGGIYAWILSRHPNEGDAPPRVVAVVELEEGIRLISNLVEVVATAESNFNGMDVEVCFVDYEGVVLPQFRPARPSVQAS